MTEPKPEPTASTHPVLKSEIAIDDFSRVDLRVGTVLMAEPIPKAKKLLKLSVDLGEAEPRPIVAGIAESYSPDDLIGKQVIVVANLKPAKLMGVESRGMLLAAATGQSSVVLTVDQMSSPGTPIR